VILATVSIQRGFHADVRAALDGRVRVDAAWDLDYNDIPRLRSLAAEQKCIVILDFTDPQAMAVARAVDGRPQIATVAVGGGGSRDELLELMQAGIRDVLPHFSYREILHAANRAAASLACAGELLADVFAFVPAKPGCGASTLATQATSVAARLAQEPTLLLDFDIRLGVTSFLLKSEGTHTIVDALLQADHLDRDIWASLVSQLDNLHLLGSGPVDFSRPFLAQRFSELLEFAIRQYSVVAVDLPGSMDDYECEVLMRATRVFLVCTSDIGALHLARRKASWFQDLRLTDKVSLVLNCAERRGGLSVEEIERIVQLPVRYLVPASANEVAKAVQNGSVIEGSSSLAKQIARIAGDMVTTRPVGKKSNPMRRFVEYFSVSAARSAEVEP
jgi:Flp pilus assembly CpaE family ATPase